MCVWYGCSPHHDFRTEGFSSHLQKYLPYRQSNRLHSCALGRWMLLSGADGPGHPRWAQSKQRPKPKLPTTLPIVCCGEKIPCCIQRPGDVFHSEFADKPSCRRTKMIGSIWQNLGGNAQSAETADDSGIFKTASFQEHLNFSSSFLLETAHRYAVRGRKISWLCAKNRKPF